jgi:hypothetical protein
VACIETIDTRFSTRTTSALRRSTGGRNAELHAVVKLAACCPKRREVVAAKVSLSNLSIASADILRLPREILAA